MTIRFSILALACALGAAACGSTTSPTSPSTAATPTFSAVLLAANETPPVTNADASGNGQVVITMATTKDSSGNVTGATATFQVNCAGLPAGTTLTGAHIHSGAAGVAGAIVVNTGLASGEQVFTSGSGSFSKANVVVTADVAQAILQNPGAYYFNVHTTLNPGGAIRGQLARAQ